jgi:hypothetical protein
MVGSRPQIKMKKRMEDYMQRLTYLKTCALALVGTILFTSALTAQPVRDRILGDLEITEGQNYTVIQVGFNFPVRYVRHFPLESGNELRIKLLPIAISPIDREALFERESIRPPSNDTAGLLEVVYEGDQEVGLFLTLLFHHPVHFQVKQGSDFRSLTVIVGGGGASAPPINRTVTPGCGTRKGIAQ